MMTPGQYMSAQTVTGVLKLTITYHFVYPLLSAPSLPHGGEKVILADKGAHLGFGSLNSIVDDVIGSGNIIWIETHLRIYRVGNKFVFDTHVDIIEHFIDEMANLTRTSSLSHLPKFVICP